jgi:GntR family transcriptional regulator
MADRSLPPYRRIAEDLRAQIESGALAPGDRVRSENELKDEYGTTRVTVRKALALLRADGLISSEQGRGAFVRPRPKVRMLTAGANFRARLGTGVANFNAEVTAQNLRPEQRIIAVERVPAPSWTRRSAGPRTCSKHRYRRTTRHAPSSSAIVCSPWRSTPQPTADTTTGARTTTR